MLREEDSRVHVANILLDPQLRLLFSRRNFVSSANYVGDLGEFFGEFSFHVCIM